MQLRHHLLRKQLRSAAKILPLNHHAQCQTSTQVLPYHYLRQKGRKAEKKKKGKKKRDEDVAMAEAGLEKSKKKRNKRATDEAVSFEHPTVPQDQSEVKRKAKSKRSKSDKHAAPEPSVPAHQHTAVYAAGSVPVADAHPYANSHFATSYSSPTGSAVEHGCPPQADDVLLKNESAEESVENGINVHEDHSEHNTTSHTANDTTLNDDQQAMEEAEWAERMDVWAYHQDVLRSFMQDNSGCEPDELLSEESSDHGLLFTTTSLMLTHKLIRKIFLQPNLSATMITSLVSSSVQPRLN